MKRLDAFEVELEGTTLIEASAGTGKTYTITTLYLRLVLESDLPVGEILVITYTRAATAELRERIRRRLGEALRAFEAEDAGDDPVLARLLARFDHAARRELAKRRLAVALTNFDEAAILTIHGFCQRALREHAFESGSPFDVELLVDQRGLLREVGADLWSRLVSREPAIVVEFMRKKHTKLDEWLAVARHGANASPPRVIPEESRFDALEIEHRAARFIELRDRVRATWETQADELLASLCRANEAGKLGGRPYSAKMITKTWKKNTTERLRELRLPISGEKKLAHLARLGSTAIADAWKKETPPLQHPFFDDCEALVPANDALQEALRDRQIALERELIEETTRLLDERKRKAARQSYDDLLSQMHEALVGKQGKRFAASLRRDFRAALVDEFQDTDQLQYEIVRRLWRGAHSTLFLIGDPKQAIYAFRGADVHAYLRAKRDAGERCFTLDVNWRSDPGFVEAVGSLFLDRNLFGDDAIAFDRVQAQPDARDVLAAGKGKAPPAALDLLFLERDAGKAWGKLPAEAVVVERVAADIAALLAGSTTIAGRPVEPGDIAILCRTNEQTRKMVEALSAIGVPNALLGDASVFETDEALELERVVEAIAEPRSLARLRAALSTRLLGFDAGDFAEHAADERLWDEWLERFAGWRVAWQRNGFIRAFHALLREREVHARLLAGEGGERRLTNLLHLVELAERAAQTEHLGPQGMVQWLARMRADREERGNAVGEDGELRLESDRDAVRVVTIHKSKGLEYPLVYCPFLYASAELRDAAKARVRFHAGDEDPEREGEVTLDLGSPGHADHLARAAEENLAEDMRMLYVALTRARHRCSVVWGAVNQAEKSALFHLLHGAEGEFAGDPAAFKAADDETLRAQLEAIAARSEGSCGVRPLADREARHVPDATPGIEAAAPRPSRVLDTPWRHSSFSQLAASEREAAPILPPLRAEGSDRDEVDDAPRPATPETPDPATGLFDALPPGPKTGVLLHSLLEQMEFESAVAPQFEGDLDTVLVQGGIAAAERPALAADFERVLAAPFGKDELRLAEVARSKRLDEVEFLLPVGAQAGGSAGLRAGDLASVLRAHREDPASERVAEEYAPRLEMLRFDALTGFLRGFVDLVFEAGGRYFVVDYKSNRLGDDSEAYAPDSLWHPMLEHHYVLQYHLYSVAMHRYLASRVPGYDYDEHFGGAYYLFLRGMDPAAPRDSGVFHHRPSARCIADLSAVLDEAGRAAA